MRWRANAGGKMDLINNLINNTPHDGKSHYHVRCRDGFSFIIETGPGTSTCPPRFSPPFSRLQLRVKRGVDELLAPHLDGDGRIGYVIPAAIEGLLDRHGGVVTPLC